MTPLLVRSTIGALVCAVVAMATAGAGTSGTASQHHAPAPKLRRSTYDALVLNGRPVSYWAMTVRNSREPDLTGNKRNGTYEGGVPSSATMPNGDRAAVFDGIGQYLTIPSAPAFSIVTRRSLTWEGWIRPDTLHFPNARNGYVDWMGKCAGYSPTCEWEARLYESANPQGRCGRLSAYAFNPTAGVGSGAYWQAAPCNQLRPGEWIYVVGEYQTVSTPPSCSSSHPGTIAIWVDGVKWNPTAHGQTGCMSEYSITPRAGSSPLNIGTMGRDSWFAGAIGKIAIYDRLLKPGEIAQRYRAMTGLGPSGSCSSFCTLR